MGQQVTNLEMTKNWIKYWRNSLADGERMEREPQRMEHLRFEQLDVSTGSIPPEHSNTLIDKYERKVNKRKGITKSTDEEWIKLYEAPVTIAPLVLLPVYEHTKRRSQTNRIYPFWINATLSRSGHLSIPENPFPMFIRRVLDPAARDDQEIAIGSVDKVDEIMGEGLPVLESWDEYWSFVLSFFKKVTGKALNRFSLEKVKAYPEVIIAVDEEIEGAADGIIKLYDYLFSHRKVPGLFAALAKPDQPSIQPLIDPSEWLADMTTHMGQMGNSFPISFSQRQSLHHFRSIDDSAVLAVNGPPGTGKTTLLQSIVANEYVQAAISGGDPFIMLACSTNNQAVTNIIHSFAKTDSDRGLLAERWLPEINSYALYMPSNAAKPSANIHYVKVNGEGLPMKIEKPNFVEKAREDYLQKANEYFENPFKTVQQVISQLQNQLKATQGNLDKGNGLYKRWRQIEGLLCTYLAGADMDFYYSDNELNADLVRQDLDRLKVLRNGYYQIREKESFWLGFFSFLRFVREKRAIPYKRLLQETPIDFKEVDFHKPASIEYAINKKLILLEEILNLNKAWTGWQQKNHCTGSPTEIEQKLDRGLRHDCFLLATHYWEGRWLLETDEAIEQDVLRKNGQPNMKRRFRRYAMLTPCFVATFYMAPKFFNYVEFDEGRYIPHPLMSFIDLLIVDEAGQVTPEVGAATFSLANKALVVGDIKQIDPIWKLPRSIDQSNLAKFELPHDMEALDQLDNQGFTASKGSIMRLAQNASTYQVAEKEARGMLLVEHRRCFDEIIDYCNQLAYHGLLQPLRGPRPADQNLPLPALGYAQVAGESMTDGGSRQNEAEAIAIADWLVAHHDLIKGYYNQGKQKMEDFVGIITPFTAQKYLLKAVLKQAGFDTNRLTVGTVHALQGAERPIILFSMVYASNEPSRTFFFDQGVNMLNVAVSRSKDSFLLFGNLEVLDENGHGPSAQLIRHLKRNGVDVGLGA